MSGEGAAVRAYAALTHLYPRRFRKEYGTDMVSVFREQCRDEPAWRVVPRTVVDLAITIPIQHLETTMHRTPNRLVPVTYLAVAVAGALLAILGGTSWATLIIGLALMLGAGTIGVLAWRRSAPTREKTRTADWWKYVLAGPCLVALVIIAAGAGVEAWFVGMACVLTAIVLTTIGLLLGVSHLYTRRAHGISS